MRDLPVRRIWGIGKVAAEKLEQRGVSTCGDMQALAAWQLQELFGRFGLELYHLCRGEDDRPVEPHRERKSLSTERTYTHDLRTIEECIERLGPLHDELVADLRKHGEARRVTGIFAKIKFSDFSQTTVARAGGAPELELFHELIAEGFGRSGERVRLLGVGVRFAEESAEEETQLELPLS
jgi:DNA polymerase-4